MAGGYREGSGRSKSGYYKGIYCGSTYELCWVIYNLDHRLEFTRFPGKLENNGVVYFPDFLLSDNKTIVETKGYESQDSVDKKTKVAEFFGYTVILLRKDDLQYAFDHVRKTYNTVNFYSLYDGYKPKYEYICKNCLLGFQRDKEITTEVKFCSRVCSGKYRKSLNVMTPDMKCKISKALLGRSPSPYKRKYKQIWITDGFQNTRIKDNDLIPDGFRRGKVNKVSIDYVG